MNIRAYFCLLLALPTLAYADEPPCAPKAMLKVVVTLEVPGAPAGHFVTVPKTVYRFTEKYGRVEEARNSKTGLHLLVVVAEPDMWIADIASGKGKYIKDEGPTFNFHSVIFGDPDIHSTVINGLEFGCEIEKLSTTGKKTANIVHESFGMVDKIEYVEGVETARMYLRAGSPIRLEVLKEGTLYVAVNYVQYTSGMPFDSTLFERPNRIEYVGTAQK